MTRVAFLIDFEHYIGGLNYIKNLLSSILLVSEHSVEPYVFLGLKAHPRTVEQFKNLAIVVQSPYFDRNGLCWYQYKFLFKSTGFFGGVNKLLKEYQIDILSHSALYGARLPYKTLNWLPDFQFLRLPEMFSSVDKYKANKHFKDAIQFSDKLVLSSYDAQNDLEQYYPHNRNKSRVLQFVVQPDPAVYTTSQQESIKIKQKYGISCKYFYLPNQFWKHKNHLVVFEAVNILKKKGINTVLICSGNLNDFRKKNKHHIDFLRIYIEANRLQENIYLLSIIPYEHVGYLIRNAIAVINPSFFEGWSSTVEEAKSIGKQVILSDINVHREQNPPAANYFDVTNAHQLADIMSYLWQNCDGGPDLVLESKAQLELQSRVKQFGQSYLNCIAELSF